MEPGTKAIHRRQRAACSALAAAVLLTGLVVAWPSTARAVIIGGIDFPNGAASFADAVVSFAPGLDASGAFAIPANALSVPDGTVVSLGEGGTLTVQFVDNALTTSGDITPDLHVFEFGPIVEFFNVAISIDGSSFLDLGNVSGQPTSIDIDAVPGVVSGGLYRFVRLTDVAPNQSPSPFGEADIDAVGAISTILTPTQPIPEPRTLVLFAVGLVGLAFALRRRGTAAKPWPRGRRTSL